MRAGVKYWRAYDIGDGLVHHFCRSDDSAIITLTTTADFGTPDLEGGTIRIHVSREERHNMQTELPIHDRMGAQTNRLLTPIGDDVVSDNDSDSDDGCDVEFWQCPVPGCSKSYVTYQNLERHLLINKHNDKLHTRPVGDSIKIKWAEKTAAINPIMPSHTDGRETPVDHPNMPCMGFALKKPSHGRRKNKEVKQWLEDVFVNGEKCGVKANPEDTAKSMRIAKDQDGKRIFQPHEWLTGKQIKSHFNVLTAKRRLHSTSKSLSMEDQELTPEIQNAIEDILSMELTELQHNIISSVCT
ncbi:uncharacterized protein [Ptychodera flava]|uniref:uncharacterized protein n=1 Tax=Ptychodera flava TaxID=63121 RepID=UPI003969C607